MKFTFGLALAAVVGLSACAEKDVVLNASYVTDFGEYQDSDYLGNHADAEGKKADGVNWTDAKEVTLTIRQNEISPMIIHLKKDVAYKVKIVNKDVDTVSFSAPEFFENVAVSSLSEAKNGEEMLPAATKPLLMSFVVPAKGERTVNLVPVLEGRYEFEDGAPGIFFNQWQLSPYSRGKTMGAIGLFIVD